FLNDHPSTAFSQVCEDKLLTLRFNPNPRIPMPHRFSNQIGVTVSILDYGTTQSAPFYEPMYEALEAAGYVRNRDIRVAGYDARLTPDIGDYMVRTKRLIEETYRDNGNRPVHLVGHSNGPLYAEYLLTHTPPAWKARYIHGFTPIAGNFPGQGSLYLIMFTGLNIQDFSFPASAANAESSARMSLTSPSTDRRPAAGSLGWAGHRPEHDPVLRPRRRYQPGGHNKQRRVCLAGDAVLPLQPDR